MEPHLLPQAIGSLIKVKNEPHIRRRMEAFGFWPQQVTPNVVIYRRICADEALHTFGYDRWTDTEPH